MTKGLLIPADYEKPIEVRSFDSLEDYQQTVGGWIEAVDIMAIHATLYVNEQGHMRDLPFNARATYLWWYETARVKREARLVGDVVVVGFPDEDFEPTDLSPFTLHLLTERTPFQVVVLTEENRKWFTHPFTYSDYFEAVGWAMILSDRVTGVKATRVLTIEQYGDLQSRERTLEIWGPLPRDEDEI